MSNEMCKSEEDDPQDAIIYFYPTWVSEQQRHALCSQLMGVTQFCTSSFSMPSIICLQSGKFSLKKMGRFILCVGTDRNIPNMILKTRADVLYQLLRLFHFDIDSLQPSNSDDDDTLSERCSQLLQVYLPILQYATNAFGNLSTLKIPKSASTVYMEAMQTLECFQEIEGVLGGTILYQNKVVATQLNHILTKQLVVCDPYRIKLPAESVVTNFHLPLGVQLLTVYIEEDEVRRLREEVKELHEALKEIKNWRKENDDLSTSNSKQSKSTKEGVVSAMKRDTSRIFTVPEEDAAEHTPDTNIGNGTDAVPDFVKEAVKARQMARLDCLNPKSFIISNPPAAKSAKTTEDLTTTRIPLRYYSLGLPQLESEWTDRSPDPLARPWPRPYYNTICDPKYPLFKCDGFPASYPLYTSRISGHIEMLKTTDNTPKKKRARPVSIELKKVNFEKPDVEKPKRQFSLPLKSTTDVPQRGVPLTPLMAKLSLLAEEQDSLETPMTHNEPIKKPVKTPCEAPKVPPAQSSQELQKEDQREQMVLYVFGSNATSVALLLENNVATNPEHIHSLWEKSTNRLKAIELRLQQCLLDPQVDGPASSAEYSYAVVDPLWGPIERGGSYQPHQLELLTTLHFTLNHCPSITDILIKGEDTVSYGYQCGQTQVFYQQNCQNSSGVPTPADLMGVIPLKAKRTLERDHGIVLL